MATPTELYIVFPDYGEEENFVTPAVISTDFDIIQKGVEELQKAATVTQLTFRVIRVTEAEAVFKVTPETPYEEEEEVDDNLLTQIGNIINGTTDTSPF